MKITSNFGHSNLYQSNNIKQTKKYISTDTVKVSKTADFSEASFEAALKKHLVKEVSSSVSTEKLKDIKEQINLNKYEIDSYSIAKKMLF